MNWEVENISMARTACAATPIHNARIFLIVLSIVERFTKYTTPVIDRGRLLVKLGEF